MDLRDWVKLIRDAKAQTIGPLLEGSQLMEYVPYSQHRVVLVLTSSINAEVEYIWGSRPDAAHGIIIPKLGQPVILTVAEHGGLVTGPVYAIQNLLIDFVVPYTEVLLYLP